MFAEFDRAVRAERAIERRALDAGAKRYAELTRQRLEINARALAFWRIQRDRGPIA